MSKVYQGGFNVAVKFGLQNTNGTYRRGITRDTATPFTWNVAVTQSSNPNPYTGTTAAWDRRAERMEYGSFWGQWTLDGQQTIGSFGIKVEDVNQNTENRFLEFTGNQLPSTESGGTEVTLGFNDFNGKLDVVRPGLGQILLEGIDSVNARYALIDQNGSVQDTKFAENSALNEGPKWEWFPQDLEFRIASNLEITNTQGFQYTIEEVQVQVENFSGTWDTAMKDDTISESFSGGSTVTFDKLEQSISGLST